MAVSYIAARAITISGVFYNAGDVINTTGWNPNVISEYIRLGWIEAQGAPPPASVDSDIVTIAAIDSSSSGVMATDGSGWIRKSYAAIKTALNISTTDVSGLATAYQPISVSGTLAAMPGTGTGSKAYYFATDSGLYQDLTNGGAYTKISDLSGQVGMELGRLTIASLISVTSTTIVALPSPGPASLTVNIPSGTQAVKVDVDIPNLGGSTTLAGTIELFVDGVAVQGIARAIQASTDVFDGSFVYEHSPSAGSHTYEVRASTNTGTLKLSSFPAGNSLALTVRSIRTS